ncbi:RICIN domain-containing protein [Alloscardovia macacae]|uniref:Glycosyl hydrolase family 25 n=1 Tax=Alloscardovia macacae TaxID=1160091 RepID=A0A261F6X6_9BIFI|nr:RICIN domain-containing protein [Alloscardovia macacae]OZG54909.1 glycosyl hydrolase family 25 [Alloscardovia macacae]
MKTFLAALMTLITSVTPYAVAIARPNTTSVSSEQAQSVDVSEARAQKENLPESIAAGIADNATVISSHYVMAEDGSLLHADTGERVTDEDVVGTETAVPDPLARTGGESFIPVSVESAREVLDGEEGKTAQVHSAAFSTEDTKEDVEPVGNWSSKYGAYWSQYNGQKAFFSKGGSLFASPARQVIDVSEWQGDINWDAVKADGVEGAIIRIGYGRTNVDKKAIRNLREAQRVGIPFGVYLYSYASNGSEAWAEGQNVVRILGEAGITNSNQMKMPIYYDLENWTFSGHKYPTDPHVNDSIVNNFFMNVQLSGYARVNVYSYLNHLNTALNTSNIHSRTAWVAAYGASMNFSFSSYERGWQYTSSGSVNGITGNVDMNAYRFSDDITVNPEFSASSYPVMTLPDGEYYITTRLRDASSLDTDGQSIGLGATAALHQYGHADSQKYRFTRNGDGTYTIINSASGLALDVYGGQAANSTKINLWWPTAGAQNQKWIIRDTGSGYMLQSALGNYVLDIYGGLVADGTSIALYKPSSSALNQRFVFSSTRAITTGTSVTIRTALNGNMALSTDSSTLGARANIRDYVYGNSYQEYVFSEVGNGIYSIRNKATGYVIDVYGGGHQAGTAVDIYENRNSQGQHWAVISDSQGQVFFASMLSGKLIDVSNAAAVSGNPLVMWTATYALNQRWALYAVPKGTVDDGIYAIHNMYQRDIVLDVYGARTANSTNVDVYTYRSGSANQQWRVVNQANGYVKLYDSNSGKALDALGASSRLGTNVGIYTDIPNARNQLWKPVYQTNGSFVLESAMDPNRVIDIYGGYLVAGTNVEIYAKGNNSSNQQWVFEKLR